MKYTSLIFTVLLMGGVATSALASNATPVKHHHFHKHHRVHRHHLHHYAYRATPGGSTYSYSSVAPVHPTAPQATVITPLQPPVTSAAVSPGILGGIGPGGSGMPGGQSVGGIGR